MNAVKLQALLFVITIFLGACAAKSIPTVQREDLFSMNIGRLEGEIDLIDIEGAQGRYKTAIAMREGLIYISNGNGQKVSRYNSYGNLLFMVYNDITNPRPLTLRPETDGETLARWAVPFPFEAPGCIAVDSAKNFYVEDMLPEERHSFDSETRVLLDRAVLCFDQNGHFIKTLGQEGPGGLPFPSIESITISQNDEVAVVTMIPAGRHIYWYDRSGNPLYNVTLTTSDIPLPEGRRDLYITIEKAAPARDSRFLFIKADYYHKTFDESTGTQTGVESDRSIVWEMNVENGKFTRFLDVPNFETGMRRSPGPQLLYSFLGTANNGRIFFYVPTADGYSILIKNILSPEDEIKAKIDVKQEETQLNAFYLAENGLLTALLADQWSAKVVWWRTDTLLSGEDK